jgi:lipopolysaccharide/colanic/teichoic acid biosynthesis glycosyltransferase/GT2 family glycosyltransferase
MSARGEVRAVEAAPALDGSRVAVILVAYKCRDDILECVAALRRDGLSGSVVLVDNDSRDGTVERVLAEFPEVRVLAMPVNAGFSAACNRGMAAVEAPYCLFLNPDARIGAPSVRGLLAFAEAHPTAGIVAPRVLDEDGRTTQLSCRAFPTLASLFFHRHSLLNRLLPHNPWGRAYLLLDHLPEASSRVDWVSGCCMLVRREVLRALHGFDERFFLFSEDVDLCLRARQAGWDTYYLPHLSATHRIAGSCRSVRPIVERHRSVWRYYRKHMARRPRLLLDPLIGLAVTVRCGTLVLAHLARRLLGRGGAAPPAGRRGGAAPRDDVPHGARPESPAKRAGDICLAALGLLCALPVGALIALGIKLTDGGAIFYGQERVGRGGRRFQSWKFRSMVPHADARYGPMQARHDDERVTPVGRLLRATALDELPQLWNILRGDMSFVGPRALMPKEIEVAGNGEAVPLSQVPGYLERHAVRPGLTGVAQIYLPRDAPRRQKFKYDLLYIRNQSFWLDVRLIALSFWITARARWESREEKL